MNNNRNATLLRAFIDEVQQTGIFPHPEIINLFEQHQQQLTQPRKLPPFPHLPTPPEKSSKTSEKITPSQNSEPMMTSNPDDSLEEELLSNNEPSPATEEEKTPDDNHNYPFSPNINPENHNYVIYLENPYTPPAHNIVANDFIPHHHNFGNNPETVIPINQEIYSSCPENNPSPEQNNPQLNPRKKRIITRDEKLIQSYIEYVRKTGDCEYPLLEKQLLHN
ncbi:hypothetical protein Cyast_1080 [Cyanobacterium stanieri PCC 7202]|uniref:Uncharacterized protein n=1 Tax=Cyanobacterium stanieri (strain ATCC 29140 / PCC 7202) TaxID=292563 RepID=K9YJJ7_CYASC|nr:hypothetical protein Cyast_1080 [Cyanobacterium stanieri PCC 7202]